MKGPVRQGVNCIIGKEATIGNEVVLGHNVIIEDGAVIGDGAYIDSNTIIRANARLGQGAFIGSNCIIGEYWMDFCMDRTEHVHTLTIGDNCLIRSGTIIYAGSSIGDDFQTGHQVTIREKSQIGDHVSIGTLSDVQGDCRIGNYVRLHSNVFIAPLSIIDSFVWIFPHAVLTNDPTPPSNDFVGVYVHSFATIASGAIIMPGLEIGQDALVGAGAIVTKSVSNYAVAVGNPAKSISDVRKIRNKITGEAVYPWRHHFSRYMPWEDGGFEEWYASLEIDARRSYSIETIDEEDA